jgi:hypothetical protein
MNFSELGRVIELIGKDRGIERSVVIKAIEQAFLVTARKKYGIHGEYETRYNEAEDDIEIFQYSDDKNGKKIKIGDTVDIELINIEKYKKIKANIFNL